MRIRLSEITAEFASAGIFIEQFGSNPLIERIYSTDDCKPGDLVFVESKEYLQKTRRNSPAAVVIPPTLKMEFAAENTLGVVVAKNVKLAHALVKTRYADRDYLTEQWGKIHASAVIHESAVVPKSCWVSPNVVIGQDVVLGENCRILAGAVVENGVVMGRDCLIHPNAVIGYNCILGNEVEIGMGSVIGSEGYGFAQDEKRKSHRLPQTGIVHLEDRVRIGSGNCIDRAPYGKTRIGAGTKTDNLCHIAHGVQIGEDCLLTAMLCVAGSTVIGDRVITSGQTGILDHMKICSDVVLVHRAGVTRDIEEPGMYAGLPHQPLNLYMKNTASLRSLAELAKKVNHLEKQLEELKKN